MKSILLIGAGEMQVPLIKRAKETGLRTIVADYDPSAPGFLYADVVSTVSTIDIEAVYKLAVAEKIDGIATSSDYPVRTVAYVCEKMGLPGLSQESSKIVTDKFLQRECFIRNHLPVPGYILISDIKDIKKCDTLNFPLIVKPVDSSASRGVVKVEKKEFLEEAYKYSSEYSKCGNVIIEEFIEGREFSVEVLIQNDKASIIAVTEKFTDGESDNFFVEEKHLIPARISESEYEGIEQIVILGIEAIGLNNAAAHVEVKLSNIGIVIIEIAGRLGGDYITSDLVPLSTGVDMLGNVLSISLGDAINTEKTKNNYAGICFLTPNNYNRSLEWIKSQNPDNIVSQEIKEFIPGREFKSSIDRLGYTIFCSESKDEMIQLMQISG
jgi:carbamoyl-phosphate synthase large subunit